MKYRNENWTISHLIDLISTNKIDLSPPYQRNFIWSPRDQRLLVDSILAGYPIPSFFVFEKKDGTYEMVDGQQRSRTIIKFWKGTITGSDKTTFNDISKEQFFNYDLSIIIIHELSQSDSLEMFYSLVNKSGKHLNKPELFKAQYHDKRYLALVEELLDNQIFIDLDLFTDASAKRMNDRSYLEELVAYLKFGITDKKDFVERLYEQDISEQEYQDFKHQFELIIGKISALNKIHPIKKSRYKQKNDFYTLFNFIHQNENLKDEVLLFQYDVLLSIQEFISPSNEDCQAFKDYAINCVSQSNSKKARTNRLLFFDAILLNQSPQGNPILNSIHDYFDEIKPETVKLINKENYFLFDPKTINSL